MALALVAVAATAGLTATAVEEPREREGPSSATTQPKRTTSGERAASSEHPRRRAGMREPSPYAVRSAPRRPPVRMSFKRPPRAGLLFDVRTGEVLWELHPNRRLPIASLTKMMTALVIARRHRPKELVKITPEALAYEGSGVGVLREGSRVRFETLLNGLLLVSGNDAAIALARHAAGGVNRFVRRMNRWRSRLGLECSHFSSPHGLQDRHNHSCARDLALLARADLANSRIRRILGTDRARFRFPVKGGYLDLYNNNPFIRMGVAGITGVKTGYTAAAGRCYVTTRRIGDRHLGVVLLHSPNPLRQVPRLLEAGART